MEAIGLNPIRLDAIGIDSIRLNAIRLGVPGASSGSDRPYIDPEVLASLVAVCICDGKSNNDPDRAIIKNLVDPDNPFVISNAAYKLNSGFGKYEEDFDSWIPQSSVATSTYSSNKLHVTNIKNGNAILYTRKATSVMKIKVTGMQSLELIYRYITGDDTWGTFKFDGDGIYELPAGGTTTKNYYTGFAVLNYVGDCDITIEQIPSFQGALVTDGVDDAIRSQKTIGEMLDGSNEITVVSMIHLIDINHAGGSGFTNYVRVGSSFIRSDSKVNDKTGIYGWTYSNSGNIGTINNILGDKNDYRTIGSSLPLDSVFNVEGYSHSSGIAEICQVAWYWTFIANRVLTSDEINQVIAYYNLDKYVKPDIYYDVKKQGLSNDTPDTDWYLKDFSGNGRDMQLYNFAKKLGSGVGKYEADYSTWIKTKGITSTPFGFKITEEISSNYWLVYTYNSITPAHKVKVSGIPEGGELRYASESVKLENGINELPEMEADSARGFTIRQYTTQLSDWTGLSVEQIHDYEGALVFDAVEDYGQFVGDLGLKDYTVAVDRAYPSLKGNGVPVISNIKSDTATPFLFEFADNTSVVRPYSFGATTVLSPMELSRKISYQSTYIYDGTAINKGLHGNTGDGLTIGRFGIDTQYANIALWSLLLFPYTLSEFLLERQLKRYKLGSIYPSNSIVFRPYITSNLPYNVIEIRINNELVYYWINQDVRVDESGKYFPKGSTMNIRVKHDNTLKIPSKIKYNGKEYETSYYANGVYQVDVTLDKTPQKIEIQIDEYIRYEDIVQPYPCIVPIIDTNGKTYSWGDKIKVGTEIQGGIIGIAQANLLPDLYKVTGYFNFNGVSFAAGIKHVIGKTNVFELTNAPTYLKANEPNCIADPQRLRIPNSSYKILGYIPDISGHGNHLKINNSAYAGMSGANGYTVDWSGWTKNNEVIITDSKITFPKGFNKVVWFCYTYSDVPAYKINVQGLPDSAHITYGGIKIHNGINELIGREGTTNAFGFIINQAADLSNLVIEQIGEYEGSFCLDGVEDYLTIPTLSHGAKQVLMKVNPFTDKCPIYEQRSTALYKFCVYLNGPTIAYRDGNNASTNTYIDGVLNSHILSNELIGITHNIVMTDNEVDDRTISPLIGRLFPSNSTYAQMALFAFMSFDDISSEEEIKELNDIVGIEGGYVESPDYYWDAYGKSNTQADDIDDGIRNISNSKMSIFDKSIAGLTAIEQTNADGKVGRVYDRALDAKNFAFNEESGYGGWLGITNLTNSLNYNNSTINNWKRGGTFIKGKNRNRYPYCGNALAIFIDNTNHILKFKIKITGLSVNDELYICQYLADSAAEQQLFNGINEVTLDLSASIEPTYRYISFKYPPLTNDVDFEFLYEYQNGLLSDGVDDNLKNTNMPVLTDYTWIMKRKRLNDKGSTTLCHKGNGSNSNAFLFEIIEGTTKTRSFGTDSTVVFPDLISWQTKNSYNGQTIASGTSVDGNVLHIFMGSNVYPYYTKAVFYKAMLYSKTIDMLSINMLKNLFEKDGLIDVNNPIFKKEEL